jgi:hypothetical protein
MKNVLISSETSVPTRATQRHITEDGILYSHRRQNLRSYKAFIGCILQRRNIVPPVRYDWVYYISKDGILHSHRRENLKSYIALTCRAL